MGGWREREEEAKKGNEGVSEGKMSLVIVYTQTLRGWLSALGPGQERVEQPRVKQHKQMLDEHLIVFLQ